MKKTIPAIAILSMMAFLSGCSIFGDKPEVAPAELVDFAEEITLRRVWQVNVGNGQGEKYNRLGPVIEGDIIYVASNNGTVMAITKTDGKRVWRNRLDVTLTGGVGAGNGLILVGTENSSIIALNLDNGEVLWETGISSEVLSTPKSNGRIVVVQSVDGKVTGLDARTGTQNWIYESTVPALSLRGTSSPLIVEDFVVAAFGNGTVAALSLANGTLRWEERVAVPTGRSEIDRLVDIDGELFLSDNGLLIVSSYQGYLAALDVISGQIRWRVRESSAQGASSGFGNVYVCDVSSHVKAYRTGQDDPVWVNDQLDLRQLSSPVTFSNYVAVGDFEGYVHFLSQVDGRFVGRTRVDRAGVRAQMLAQDNTLYVYGNGGNLTALRVQ